MKTWVWLLIIFVVLALAGGGFFLYTKKTKVVGTGLNDSDEKKNKPSGGGSGTQAMRELQMKLNTLLPDTHPKLVVDGIYGPKTAEAQRLIEQMRKNGTLPAEKTVTTPSGTVTINTGAVIDKALDVADTFLSINPLYAVGSKIYSSIF